jgi:Kef-type K+ transport system membrane component KefB
VPPVFAFLAVSPEATQLLLSLLIVFGSAKLLAEVCERFRQPGIVGAILAGVFIGPSCFGWIQPNDLLHALSELGVMFLLFRVGLEVKASEMLKVGGTAMLVATLGVVVPFLLGWGILALAGHRAIESIFMGAAMVATSVGITAQVLADKGLLAHRTAKIILAAAVIDDVLGLLVLAVVSSMAQGAIDYVGLTLTTSVAVLFVLAVAKYGTTAMSRILPRVRRNLRSQEAEFAIAMVFLFAMSLLAIYSGVAAIVGAFLAGMALAESVGQRVHDLAHGATELMVPFFLTGIGLQMNLAVFKDPGLLLLSLVILVAALLGKWIGCGAGAWSLGRLDAHRIGVGMAPRGEVGMVVAQIGLARGAIGQEVYAVAVFMAVATTIIAPPLLNQAYRGLAAPAPEDETTSFRLG